MDTNISTQIESVIDTCVHKMIISVSKLAGEQLGQHMETDSIIDKAKTDIYNALIWEIEYNSRQIKPGQTQPPKTTYNNDQLIKDLNEGTAKWIQLKSRGLLHSIEPNTQNKTKAGFPVRLMIIDALAEVMDGPKECLLHIYHYKTEQDAEQDIELINTLNPHGINIMSF